MANVAEATRKTELPAVTQDPTLPTDHAVDAEARFNAQAIAMATLQAQIDRLRQDVDQLKATSLNPAQTNMRA